MVASLCYDYAGVTTFVNNFLSLEKFAAWFRQQWTSWPSLQQSQLYRTRKKIITILGMSSPIIVSASPEKANITYWVRQKSSIEEVFTPLAHKLKKERVNMPRMIIFCKRCEECALLYQFFHSVLKKEFFEPVEAPDLARYRLVDMYMSVTENSVKSSIVTSFCKSGSPLRVVMYDRIRYGHRLPRRAANHTLGCFFRCGNVHAGSWSWRQTSVCSIVL